VHGVEHLVAREIIDLNDDAFTGREASGSDAKSATGVYYATAASWPSPPR